MDAAFARLGYVRGSLLISAENILPHGRGLGSSASAIVAAISAANALVAEQDRQDAQWILQLASELEGHPDNVAPAIFGSVAISWQQDGRFRSAKVAPARAVVPVVAVPAVELSTETARAMLPTAVAHQDAAANSGRTALLIHALTQDPSLLLEGTQDFLHQGYRAQAMPASAELMDALRAQGFAAFISGAGPTVMTLANGASQARRAADFIARWRPAGTPAGTPAEISAGGWRVLLLEVDTEGAKVEVHRR
jgi:homoserine kinase